MSYTVCIVEDESDLAHILEFNLQNEGYQTRIAATGADALKLVQANPLPDIVLLDLMLPDMTGIEVCRVLKQDRATAHIPIIMVTAKGEEIDRIVGFEMGADDYVVKPYSVRELLLRVRALLKRVQSVSEQSGHVTFGCLQIDRGGHRLWVDDNELVLTALEFRLLTTLMERKGRVQTRTGLLQDVWDIHADVTTRTVDTHVKRLRQKLGSAGQYIETIRGVGYRFVSRTEEPSE